MPLLLLENEFTPALISQINNAKDKIYGSIFYAKIYRTHRNDLTKKTLDALSQAQKRKVLIRLIVNRRTDQEKVITSNNQFVNLARKNNIDARLSNPGRINHAKFWVFDDKISIIGSHNLTLRAMRISREVSIEITDEGINRQLTVYFLDQFYNIKCHFHANT